MNPSAAQAPVTPPADPPVITLTPVTVEADAIRTSAERAIADKRNAPNAVTVIEAEQLNQFGDQPLGDALRRLPGITFPGGNRARDVQLRGVGVEYSQVLVNGRALIDGNSKRSVQVDRIPSSLVERVEIIRSPLASQDGQGAAGTLNIILKNQRFDERTELGAGIGYLDKNGLLGDSTLLHSMTEGPFSLVISGGVQRQRRNESKDTLSFTGSAAPNAGVLEKNERRFDQVNITPSLEYRASGTDTFRFEPIYLRTKEYRDDVQTDLTANQQAANRVEKEKRLRTRENYGGYGAWTHAFTELTNVRLDFDYQRGVEDTDRDAVRRNAAGVVDRTRQRTEDITLERWSPTARVEHKLGSHILEAGLGYVRSTRDEDNSEVTNGTVGAPNRTRKYDILEERRNLYTQGRFRPSENDQFTVGLRLEDTDTEATDFFGAKSGQDSLFLLPSVNYVHTFATDTDARIGVARTLRRPDLRELSPSVQTAAGTLASPDTGGNPDVVPEAIWGADIGLDQYFASGRGVVGVNLFGRLFDDKIETISQLESGRFVARPQNVGTGHMYGVELEGRVPLDLVGLENLTLWANGTRIFTQLKSEATGETRRFLDQHDYVANLGIDWYVPALKTTFGAALNHVSGYEQNYRLASGNTTRTKVGSATRFDLSTRTQLTESIALSISALNIFAAAETRSDRTLNAAGVLTGYSNTDEPTYRAIYARVALSL